jgi:2-amino-4-hydroxy-6-hydroxymethyldihydropteridine diphosphokinase
MRPASRGVGVELGLGSNLGDREEHLRAAVSELERRGVACLRMSPLYESRYVGPGAPQPEYLNAVLEASTDLGPLELLDVAQEVERRRGRRPGTHLLPRPLDVDILLYGRWTVVHPRLVIPHPRLAERRFVLEPLHDLGRLSDVPARDLFAALGRLRVTQPLQRHPALGAGDRRDVVRT